MAPTDPAAEMQQPRREGAPPGTKARASRPLRSPRLQLDCKKPKCHKHVVHTWSHTSCENLTASWYTHGFVHLYLKKGTIKCKAEPLWITQRYHWHSPATYTLIQHAALLLLASMLKNKSFQRALHQVLSTEIRTQRVWQGVRSTVSGTWKF